MVTTKLQRRQKYAYSARHQAFPHRNLLLSVGQKETINASLHCLCSSTELVVGGQKEQKSRGASTQRSAPASCLKSKPLVSRLDVNFGVATRVQFCNGWEIKDGRSPQDTRGPMRERQLSPAFLQMNTGMLHFHPPPHSKCKCPCRTHMHAEAAICLCTTVLKYINRRFNLTAVAFIYHSTLQIKVNYLRRQKLGQAKICCRGLCSMRGFIAVTTVNFPIFLLAQTFGLKTFH